MAFILPSCITAFQLNSLLMLKKYMGLLQDKGDFQIDHLLVTLVCTHSCSAYNIAVNVVITKCKFDLFLLADDEI